MAEFFKTSTVWVVDFLYEGRARRWLRAFKPEADPQAVMADELHALYGRAARLVQVRRASADEEDQFLRGEGPQHSICPTGRR